MLHIAAARGSRECADLLLKNGARVYTKNVARWTPFDEALARRDKRMAADMQRTASLRFRKECESRKDELLRTLEHLGDFSLEMRWEFGSPVLGGFLRKHFPNDTYRMYKRGLNLRVDGSFVGYDDEANTLLPRLKRSPFSVILRCCNKDNAPPEGIEVLYVDWNQGIVSDMLEEGGPFDVGEISAEELDRAISRLMTHSVRPRWRKGNRLKTESIFLRPLKGWRGERPRTERVDGWLAEVYEAHGHYSKSFKGDFSSRYTRGSFAEYIHLSNESSQSSSSMSSGLLPRRLRRSRPNRGQCWFVKGFPLKAHDLLPIFRLLAFANKQFQKVEEFLRDSRLTDRFPIRIRIPLAFTVHALVTFRAFRKDVHSPSFSTFEPPPSFKRVPAHLVFDPGEG